MELNRAPLIAVIIIIEIVMDIAILLAVSAATVGLSYSSELVVVAAAFIIALEVWLDLKYFF
ncbi:MAG: hypothetical protein ACP5UZ_08055 [Thermoplasmata archaeon]